MRTQKNASMRPLVHNHNLLAYLRLSIVWVPDGECVQTPVELGTEENTALPPIELQQGRTEHLARCCCGMSTPKRDPQKRKEF